MGGISFALSISENMCGALCMCGVYAIEAVAAAAAAADADCSAAVAAALCVTVWCFVAIIC